jgi:transcriptional regulator with XRE-family HTH domain
VAIMVRVNFLEVLAEKEKRLGKRYNIEDVAKSTGLHRDTVSGYWNGETKRFDAPTLEKLCEFFEVEDGKPVPFLIAHHVNDND